MGKLLVTPIYYCLSFISSSSSPFHHLTINTSPLSSTTTIIISLSPLHGPPSSNIPFSYECDLVRHNHSKLYFGPTVFIYSITIPHMFRIGLRLNNEGFSLLQWRTLLIVNLAKKEMQRLIAAGHKYEYDTRSHYIEVSQESARNINVNFLSIRCFAFRFSLFDFRFSIAIFEFQWFFDVCKIHNFFFHCCMK